MNETRKKIIELIQPYMDKTLEFGCIVMSTQECEELQMEVIYYYWAFWRSWDNTPHYTSKDDEDIKQIIGHYTLDAVLKYIDNVCWSSWGFHFQSSTWNITIWKNMIEWTYDSEICKEIPNKPLTLYTDEEEKELLDLLQKIGWQEKK